MSPNTEVIGTSTLGIESDFSSGPEADIVWSQEMATDGTVWSVVANHFEGANYGIYAADDFELTNDTKLETVQVFGSQIMGNLESILLGFNVYIYEDTNNFPSNDPSEAGVGLYEITNITLASNHITIEQNPSDPSKYSITINLEDANGGEVLLPSGKYWISVFPTMNLSENDGLLRWTWTQSVATPLEPAKMVDPTGATGLGIEDWTNISTVGLPMDGLAFILSGTETLATPNTSITQTTIWPNPVANILNIEIPKSHTIEDITLYNMLGVKVNCEVNLNNNTINLEDLSSGVYILNLTSNSEIYSKYIIKK
ncbi:T9SS type A sorting domain-containing protein [Aequorivita sinensis]|uniref:T9SS type A sorting domain-containing protein n=1 Tax=Aequorivita sinensis TaxID=1382458 RepID=UPI0023012455|nr:T9SS type A sorting domain-containing protein [Aequorivita sinensis]